MEQSCAQDETLCGQLSLSKQEESNTPDSQSRIGVKANSSEPTIREDFTPVLDR